jgi:hypothetical protein
MRDRRDPDLILHEMFELVTERSSAIDFDHLRHDPLMRVTVGRYERTSASSWPIADDRGRNRCPNGRRRPLPMGAEVGAPHPWPEREHVTSSANHPRSVGTFHIGEGLPFSTCASQGCLLPVSFPANAIDTMKEAKMLSVSSLSPVTATSCL